MLYGCKKGLNYIYVLASSQWKSLSQNLNYVMSESRPVQTNDIKVKIFFSSCHSKEVTVLLDIPYLPRKGLDKDILKVLRIVCSKQKKILKLSGNVSQC